MVTPVRADGSPPRELQEPRTCASCDRLQRRHATLAVGALLAAAGVQSSTGSVASAKDNFVTTSSGLRVLDFREGTGATPKPGDTVVVHWSGYTSGYQAKRIDNTSTRDEPFEFVLGSDEVIGAFNECVAGMRVGGLRRMEVPGETRGNEKLSYPIDSKERFKNLVPLEYAKGPQPKDLGGQRALDFVLDNPTLQPFNRTLLFDVSLIGVRSN